MRSIHNFFVRHCALFKSPPRVFWHFPRGCFALILLFALYLPLLILFINMAAATIFHYFLLILIGGFLYLLFVYIADVFHVLQNIFLSEFPGVITEQTVTAVNFVTGVIIAAPFLVLITIGIWAVVKGGTN